MSKQDWQLTPHDRDILMPLAERVRAAADSPRNQEIVHQWYLYDECKSDRPLFLTETDAGIHLVAPDFKLECSEEWARNQERYLRDTLIHVETIGDDSPVAPHINCKWHFDLGDYRCFLPSDAA